MFYNLLKAGVAIQIWRWLKPRLFGLVLVAGSILAILIAHSEYLNYVVSTGNAEYVGMSYLLKWGGLLLAALLYGIYNWLSIRRALRRRSLIAENEQNLGDGFDFLRNKRKLKSQNESKH